MWGRQIFCYCRKKRPTMQLSTHYYVLSLSEQICRLYEGFRDILIDIQNTGFPIEFSKGSLNSVGSGGKDIQLTDFFRKADRHFAHYYEQDPLRLVLMGEKKNQSIFKSVTTFQEIVIGTIEGNYDATSPGDLGKIVWSVVKNVLAGASEKAIYDLEIAQNTNNVVLGIEAVGRWADSGTGAILFVEEDYHIKGRIRKTDHSLEISEEVDIREINDDAVDIIIEKVLEMGGKVVFLVSNSLIRFHRIALILRRGLTAGEETSNKKKQQKKRSLIKQKV